jgi:ribonuclease HIII
MAFWGARQTNQRAKIDERGVELRGAVCGNKLRGVFPDLLATGGRIDPGTNIEQAREQAGHVGFYHWQGLMESKGGDCVRRVTPDAGQLPDGGDVIGKNAALPAVQDFCGGVEISRALVIAQALPTAKHIVFRGARQRNEIGETAKPLVVIRNYRGDLRLLQHEFGHQNRVRIAGLAPGEIAAMLAKPAQKRTSECANFCWRGHDLKANVQRLTPNVQLSIQKVIEHWPLSVERWALNSYTHALTQEQVGRLRALLEERGFTFAPREWTIFFAQKNKLSVAVYEKGPKVLVQGKGVEEFVQFELEPKILGEAKLGYEEVHSPEMFQPHFGVDESGKGDFFGPLVISGVYVDGAIARKLLDAGVVDSKRIGSDARIRALARVIRKATGDLAETVLIGPQRYNELYEKFGNLNKLLGWGHARVIENLLAKKPDCPRSLSDQFADASVVEQSLLRRGRRMAIQQRPRAESDIAVAAASILAREAFIDWLERKERELGLRLERGASASVKETAKKLVETKGPMVLRELAKVHFRTAHKVAPEHYAAPRPRENWPRPRRNTGDPTNAQRA